MPAFEAAVAAVRGKAYSSARDIFVEVDSAGRVVDLRLTEHAIARGAQRVTHEILATIREAEAQARTATLRAVGDLLGEDDPIVEQLKTTGTPR